MEYKIKLDTAEAAVWEKLQVANTCVLVVSIAKS